METKIASRSLDEGRISQGFKSQAQLDAFFRHYDHTKGCTECQRPGRGVELDDGIQPTMNSCATADILYAQYVMTKP